MSDQKNWDAALIKTWRNFGNLHDLFSLFTALSGKKTNECDPPLIRMPRTGMPTHVGVRMFVAHYLPKINDRLLEQHPDKDVFLLRKLETSAYDIHRQARSQAECERDQAKRQTKSNTGKTVLGLNNYANRNHSTDWNVTKGPSRIRRSR